MVRDFDNDPEEYIRQNEDLLNRPAECSECDSELGAYDLIFLDEEGNVFCGDHKDNAIEVVRVKGKYGNVNNGMHPDTGEKQYFDGTTKWFEITSREKI